MKNKIFLAMSLVATSLFMSVSAQADWFGDVNIHHARRGTQWDTAENGSQPTALSLNIADYEFLTASFAYYEAGVTDQADKTQIWQKVEAKWQMVDDADGHVIHEDYAQVAGPCGQDGNNTCYTIGQPYRNGLNSGVDVNYGQVMKAHFNILINKQIRISVPFTFTAQP